MDRHIHTVALRMLNRTCSDAASRVGLTRKSRYDADMAVQKIACFVNI